MSSRRKKNQTIEKDPVLRINLLRFGNGYTDREEPGGELYVKELISKKNIYFQRHSFDTSESYKSCMTSTYYFWFPFARGA